MYGQLVLLCITGASHATGEPGLVTHTPLAPRRVPDAVTPKVTPRLVSHVPLNPASWGVPAVNQSFPYGLVENPQSGLVFLVGAQTSAPNQTLPSAHFKSMCLLALDPTASTNSSAIWERCGVDLVVQLDSSQLVTCEGAPLTGPWYSGYNPALPLVSCKPDGDLVAVKWTTQQEILRVRVVPPKDSSPWKFSLASVVDLSMETGRVLVGATNATNAKNHALLLLVAAKTQTSTQSTTIPSPSPPSLPKHGGLEDATPLPSPMTFQWAYHDPFDQDQITQGQPDGPCWASRVVGPMLSRADDDGSQGWRPPLTPGFAPDDPNMWMGACSSGYTGSPSGQVVSFVVLDATSGSPVGRWFDSARFYKSCLFLGAGHGNEVECFPGGKKGIESVWSEG